MKPLFASIRDRNDLAEALGISTNKLKFLVEAAPYKKYTMFPVPKKDGRTFRLIEAPQPSLKISQKKLYELLSPYYTPLCCVHGFVSGRSILTGAGSHLLRNGASAGPRKQARHYFSLDIEDFFPSISSQRIYGLLIGKRLRAPSDVAYDISQLCVGERGLAQGSPVSPLISNMICLSLDRAILDFAKDNGLFYTRYADDITLSTSNRKRFMELFGGTNDPQNPTIPDAIRTAITEHNGRESFKINMAKTHYRTPSQRQIVTGVVVNEKLNVTREYRRKLRSCLHTWHAVGKNAAAEKYYRTHEPTEEELASFETRVYGKLDHYRNVISKNNKRCTPLEALGSMFNLHCTGNKFPIHKPEDSIFIIRAYSRDELELEEGVAFLLKDVGLVTSRHTFDKFSYEGVKLKVSLTSVTTNDSLEFYVTPHIRETEKHYDCVKLEADDQFRKAFPLATPLVLEDFTSGTSPISPGEELTAFDPRIISDVDQGTRGYECPEMPFRCKAPSRPNQYGRLSQIDGAEFYLGMSGGPILNQKGAVVGIVYSGIERGSGSRNTHSKLLYLDRLDKIPYGVCTKS